MRSRPTKGFWKLYEQLPQEERARARKAFELWLDDPWHPSLHFKCVDRTREIYSVRVSARLRALGQRSGDEMTWVWIGDHDAYVRLIRRG